MKYCFADMVVVEKEFVGVVLKSWINQTSDGKEIKHEVYVRSFRAIKEYPESEIERYMVRHKELSEEEQEYQYNAQNNL